MKTISAHTEAAIDNPYVDVIRLIEITIGSITLYFCDRVFGDDDLCEFNGQLYEPLIASWGDIAMGRINPVTYEPEPGSASFSVINSQPVGGVDSFSELFAANDPQYCPVLISEIHAGASNADDKEDIFKGGIEDLPGMTVDLVNVSCTGYELTVANKFIHTIVDDTTYPGADPDDLGKMVPQIYGTVKRSPCITADVGGVTTLAQAMLTAVPGNSGELLISDASAFPSSGAFTAQVDGEQIRFASRSGNTLTLAASGARGYNETTAAPHDLGASVAEIQSAYVYLIADHPIKANDDLYVDGVRQRTGKIPDIETIVLLHMDGVDASPAFTDNGFYEHTVTPYGNAQIDTAQKVFGTGAGLFDGTGDYVSIAGHPAFDFLNNSLEFDLRLRFDNALTGTVAVTNGSSAVVGTSTLFTSELSVGDSIKIETETFSVSAITDNTHLTLSSNYAGSTDSGIIAHANTSETVGIFQIHEDGNTRINLYYINDGSTGKLGFYVSGILGIFEITWDLVPVGWYHIATTRVGNTLTVWVDGVSKGTKELTGVLNYLNSPLEIGRSYGSDAYGSIYYFKGWLDEFRASNGKYRWDETFTPPTEAYPYWGDVGGLAADVRVYTGQSGDEYSGYSGKAVVVFQVLPKLEKQVNLSVSDSGHDHGGTTGYADIKITGNSTSETVIGKQVSVDCQGNLDDGSGTYTGTPSALVERPDHISKHVIIVCCGLTASEIDTTSYTAAGTFFNTNSFTLSFVILQRPNVRKLLHRIASQAKAMQFWGAGKHHISPIETSPAVDKAIDDNRIDLGQISLKYTDRINIKNKLTARYSRQWSGHANDVESDRAIVIASDATSIATFGTLQGDPESYPYINGETQAQAVLNWKLSDSKASRLIAEPAGGYYLSDIERGDIIRFDNMEIVGETLTTGHLLTLGGDNLATLSGDQLIWWLSESAGGDEYLKKALIALVTMGTTLFRVIDKKYRQASTVQIEAVKI